jgi:lipopolysaccharide export system permease protein
MRLLDRYLLRELLAPFGCCLGGFLIFWIAFDLFSDLNTFQRLRLKPADVLEYYGVKLPEMLVLVLPMALLLALLYTLTHLARHHELTAMRAAGLSLGRLALPFLGTGFVLSLAMFAMDELWVPDSAEAAETILHRRQTGAASEGSRQWVLRFGFVNRPAGRHWLFEAYNKFTGGMVGPHVTWTRPDGGFVEVMAERGARAGGVWVFTNAHRLTYPPEEAALPMQEQMDVLELPEFDETPAQIRSEIKMSRLHSFREVRRAQLSIREIIEYKQLHPEEQWHRSILDTKLHGRLAAPWTCLVVVLIALPYGAAPGRRNVFVGVASSILICFAYFVLQQLSLALGAGGHVPPWAAAWAPNVFFAAGGILLTLRMR